MWNVVQIHSVPEGSSFMEDQVSCKAHCKTNPENFSVKRRCGNDIELLEAPSFVTGSHVRSCYVADTKDI